MKTYQIIPVFCFISFLANCTKSIDATNSEPGRQLEVLEYKSNTPIANAKIDLLTCTRYDVVFGCRSIGTVSTKFTDVKGLCRFTSAEYNKADEGLKISKAGYWTRGGSEGKNYLEPEATLSLHVIKQTAYPDTSYMSIAISSEFGLLSYLSFKAPSDSTVLIKAFGNEANNTTWTVYTKSPLCSIFCVTDTLARGSFSKPISKMETGSFTLQY